eukprot:252798_1
MQIRINLNVKSLIAFIANLTLNYINTKMTQKSIQQEADKENTLNYNESLLPNIAISLNDSMDIDESNNNSKLKETKQLKNDSHKLIQLTQIDDPNNEYIYSPRRTRYITRASIQSNNDNMRPLIDMKLDEISEHKEISHENFRLGNTNKNYNKYPKIRNSTSLQWSFPIVGHTNEEREKLIANRDKNKYPNFITIISPKNKIQNGK